MCVSSNPETLLGQWKEKHKLHDTIRSSTITCGLCSVVSPTMRVPKGCCDDHVDIVSVINHTAECVSRMKVAGSLFASWQVHHRMQQGESYPVIDTKHFTQIFLCITGRQSKSIYNEEFTLFKQETGFADTIQIVKRISQVLEHTKNEMVTVFKNGIVLNFPKRIRSCLRWEIFNMLRDDPEFIRLRDRNAEAAKLVDKCVACVSAMKGLLTQYEPWSVETISRVNMIIESHQDELRTSLVDAHRMVEQRKQEKRDTAIKRKMNKEIKMGIVDQKAKLNTAIEEKKTSSQKKAKKSASLLAETLSTLPHLVLPYLYWARSRIDSLPLSQEYEEVRLSAHENKKAWKSWKFGNRVRLPMFKLLPINHTKIHFIRIDKAQLHLWGLPVPSDRWWLDEVFDVYSKTANIRPLRRYMDYRTPSSTVELCDLVDHGDKGPYLPGLSIQTDGCQIKIPILSLRNVTPNLSRLFERAYTGIPVEPEKMVDISSITRGIYKASGCVLAAKEVNRDVLGCDPGRKRPLTTCKSKVQEILHNTTNVILNSVGKEKYIDNDTYHGLIGSTDFHAYDLQRRTLNTHYKQAIEALQCVRKKTCNASQMTNYIKIKLEHEKHLSMELHTSRRKRMKFMVYRRTQSTVAKYVKDMLQGCQNPIIFFGDGCFPAGGHGYAPVPKKRFIRQFAQYAVVILVDEFHTSKLCPRCHSELSDVESTCQSERLRMCPTKVEGSPCFEADRDCIGGINIMQKGMFQLCGTPLPAFERGS